MTTSTELRAALNAAVRQLEHSGTDSARLDAEVLLAHVLDKQRVYLLTWPEQALTDEQHNHYQQLIDQRIQGI
ncbi:MAG TPA: protein-(glutamine-N5) methyltransferase, release factor-specific, partial [Gammaproteobacteria bacterium]|nr:protein-(glutamine-N5) methyltransferase, release factor-specific [Gammaproteobacteria bacterium]